MKYLAAYCLAALSGKDAVAKDDVVKILKAVGIEPATENVDRLLTTMKGKKLHEVIAEGLKKVSTLAAPSAAAPAKQEAKKEEKKEEPKKEEKKEEEEDVDLGAGGLFGDEDF